MNPLAQPLAVDSLSRSEQDYLKAIYRLSSDDAPINTLALAAALGVKPASVTNMLQKLDEYRPPLVHYQKRSGVTLTEAGQAAALRIIRRHRLIEHFLHEVLGYSWEEVHAEAEVLEHAVSPYFEQKLAEFLGEPAFDPHGDPIPSRALDFAEREALLPLTELAVGQAGRVRYVSDQRPALLHYLGQVGLVPGAQAVVRARNPLDGTVQLEVSGTPDRLTLGCELQEGVWVAPDSPG